MKPTQFIYSDSFSTDDTHFWPLVKSNESKKYIWFVFVQISIGVTDQYPVMFYIHGGDLEHGASNQFPGHMLAGWGEVVVVTFNYRLGALGQ